MSDAQLVGVDPRVEFLDRGERLALLAGNRPQAVALLDRIVADGRPFGCEALLLLDDLLVGAVDVVLLVERLGDVARAGVEIAAAQHEDVLAQLALLVVRDPLRIEGVALVARLEVEVRAGGAAGGTTQADLVARMHPVAHLDLSLRKMAVVGLQAVLVADHDEVAVALVIRGHAHAAVECRHHGRARPERQVHALVAPPVAVAEAGEDLGAVGAHERARGVHQADAVAQRKAVQRGLERIDGIGDPVLDEGLVPLHLLEILDVVPGMVVPQDEQQPAVVDVQRVHVDTLALPELARLGGESGRDAQRVGRRGFPVGLRAQDVRNQKEGQEKYTESSHRTTNGLRRTAPRAAGRSVLLCPAAVLPNAPRR